MKMFQFLFLFALLFPYSQAADFCVGDLNLPETPSGWPCKPTKDVTVDDFVFSGLGVGGNTSNDMGSAVSPGFVDQFPGLNGLGISMARADLAPGGVLPIHHHPAANEIVLVLQGSIFAGFLSVSATKIYLNVLNEGAMMILPRGLLHFHNNANKDAIAVTTNSFSSTQPGLQTLGFALPPEMVEMLEKTMSLDDAQVKKLFGGLGYSST